MKQTVAEFLASRPKPARPKAKNGVLFDRDILNIVRHQIQKLMRNGHTPESIRKKISNIINEARTQNSGLKPTNIQK